MQIKQFEYVREIAACKSITQAAQKLYVSQQALSEALKLLEGELGFQIFERSNKGVSPTKAGEKFLQDLDGIMAVIYSWKELAEEQQKYKTIKILVQYLLSDLLVNVEFLEWLNSLKYVDIEWETDNAKQVIDLVAQRQFHLGILHLFQDSVLCSHLEQLKESSSLVVKKVMDSKMAIALRADDALATKKMIGICDLHGKQVVQNRAFGENSYIVNVVRCTGIEERLLPQSVNVLEYVLQHENTISYLPEFILRSNMHVKNGKIVIGYLEQDLECALYFVYPRVIAEQEVVKKLERYFLGY